jgi:hypothetical protein
MFKIATRNQKLIRLAYSSRWLSKFVVFNISGINSVGDSALRNAIISNMSTEERHGKTTAAGRFADLDEVASKYVSHHGANFVHDIGVSSGITSCDFYDAVFSKLNVEYCISDKYTHYYYTGKKVVRIFDADKRLLYGYFFSLLADNRLRCQFPVSRILYHILEKIPATDEELKDICLFDPKTIEYLDQGKLKCIDYDVFRTSLAERFTYVRCMNVLNRNLWFSEQQLSKALMAICGSLIEGGILQVGRSRDDGTHDASFLRKERGHMLLLESINRGSEVSEFVLTYGLK